MARHPCSPYPLASRRSQGEEANAPGYWVIEATNVCVCVGADVPDAVSVTVYLAGWEPPEPPSEAAPQPARNRVNAASTTK